MLFIDLIRSSINSIRVNKLRSFLTMVGVMIGVLCVTLFVSIGEAVQQYLVGVFAGLGSNVLQVAPGHRDTQGLGAPPLNTVRKLTLEDVEALRRRAGLLDGASGIVSAGGTNRYLNRRRDTFIFGVEPEFSEIREIRPEMGRFFSKEDIQSHRRYVVLGQTVVRELFGDENPIGHWIKIDSGQFQVLGVMEKKGTTLGFDVDDLVYIPVTTAMDLFGTQELSNIATRSRNKEDIEDAKQELTDILSHRHNDKIDFTIVSQDDILSTVGAITGTMKTVLLFIASISLLVGGIGIANIMLVSVRERTREIGVRRAVGAKKRDILSQFLFEAVFISILGGSVGLLLGGGILLAMRFAKPELPFDLSTQVIFVALAFSIGVGIISGVAPARSAAQLDPVESLRYE